MRQHPRRTSSPTPTKKDIIAAAGVKDAHFIVNNLKTFEPLNFFLVKK